MDFFNNGVDDLLAVEPSPQNGATLAETQGFQQIPDDFNFSEFINGDAYLDGDYSLDLDELPVVDTSQWQGDLGAINDDNSSIPGPDSQPETEAYFHNIDPRLLSNPQHSTLSDSESLKSPIAPPESTVPDSPTDEFLMLREQSVKHVDLMNRKENAERKKIQRQQQQPKFHKDAAKSTSNFIGSANLFSQPIDPTLPIFSSTPQARGYSATISPEAVSYQDSVYPLSPLLNQPRFDWGNYGVLDQIRTDQTGAERLSSSYDPVGALLDFNAAASYPDGISYDTTNHNMPVDAYNEAEQPLYTSHNDQQYGYQQAPSPPLFVQEEVSSSIRKGTKAVHVREPGNKRSANIRRFDPKEHYVHLPAKPRSWGSIDQWTGRPSFQYTPTGEFLPRIKFTKQQFQEFLEHHPQFDGPLTLWIQICPADSNSLYPDPESHKCRFHDCFIKNKSIAVGDYRVALDEHSSSRLRLDPLQSTAGYVHLYCLEKFFDFPQLCSDYNVRPDTRAFPNPKPFAINRDEWADMEKVIENFMRHSKSWRGERDSATWYARTLCYALTAEHLEKEPNTRQQTRAKRDGNSIDKHCNNLEIKAENLIKKRAGKPLKTYQRPAAIEEAPRQTRKRKSRDDDDEDSEPSGLRSSAKRIKTEVARNSVSNLREEQSARCSPRIAKTRTLYSNSASIQREAEASYPVKLETSQSKKRSRTDDDVLEFSIGSPAKKIKISEPADKPRRIAKKPVRLQISKRRSGDDSMEKSERSSAYDADGSASDESIMPTPVTTRTAPKRKAVDLDPDASTDSESRQFRQSVSGSLNRYGMSYKRRRGNSWS